jgi:hypothetical protein
MWTPYGDIMRRRWLPDFTDSLQDIPESITESDITPYSNDMVICSGQNKN